MQPESWTRAQSFVAVYALCSHIVYTMATTVDWESIRRLAEQGVPFRRLAETHGLQLSTLYTRSSREGWLTPEKTQLKIAELIKTRTAQRTDLNGQMPPRAGAEGENSTLAVIADTWQRRADDIRQLSFRVAARAIREAEGRVVVESASDLAHAVKVARQATGLLDDKAPVIALGIFSAQDDPMNAGMPCFDAEIVQSSSVVMADPYEL